ncbi:hypothetical protein [Adhaeribacter pallidiroseus]|uniref:Uncharacterized protein n=1 Tax=Adhaeribacter pallidiroseus TaxID=2072847 RepID=A0A369QMM6_9BACT|nr:hypothetical protein [Adhaeribacter pallidiroseus]RDC65994.1 hypothetical protein AHMF7616_04625 [Adhaeribacter pallidiroseus]
MKQDINFDPVEGVSIAVILETDAVVGAPEWGVYLINQNDVYLDNVLVSSKGYGEQEGEKIRTSILRHMFEQVQPKSFVKVEPIDPAIFQLYNEYWVSYYIGRKIYDKKFVFVPGSIVEDNLIYISMIGLKGVLHT